MTSTGTHRVTLALPCAHQAPKSSFPSLLGIPCMQGLALDNSHQEWQSLLHPLSLPLFSSPTRIIPGCFPRSPLLQNPHPAKLSSSKQINKLRETGVTPCPLSAPGPHITQRIPGMGIRGATAGFSSSLGSCSPRKTNRLWNSFCFEPVLGLGRMFAGRVPG